MSLRRYSKVIGLLLCLIFCVSASVVYPGQTVYSLDYIIYVGTAQRVELDGVVYWYRNDVDDFEKIQITAIQVPDGRKDLILPETIDGRVVACLHLRKKDGAVPLTGVTSLCLPSGMTYQGSNYNPTCVSPDSDYMGEYLVPSLDYFFTSLEQIRVAADSPYMTVVQGVLYDKDVTTMLYYPYEKKDTEYTEPSTQTRAKGGYDGRKYLKKLTFSNHKENAYAATCQDTNLETVVIPKNIQYIWFSSFENCTKLKRVEGGKGLITIFERAFFGCTSLTSFPFASSDQMHGIETEAFRGCSRMKKIKLPKNLRVLYDYVFYDTPCRKVTIPPTVVIIRKKAFAKGTKLKKQDYLKSVKSKYVEDEYTKEKCSYVAMAEVEPTGSGRMKYYWISDLDPLYPLRKKLRMKKKKRTRLRILTEVQLPMDRRKEGYLSADILRFTSSNPKVVKVSKKGVMKALKKGTAVIHVELRTQGLYEMASGCEVKVRVR